MLGQTRQLTGPHGAPECFRSRGPLATVRRTCVEEIASIFCNLPGTNLSATNAHAHMMVVKQCRVTLLDGNEDYFGQGVQTVPLDRAAQSTSV